MSAASHSGGRILCVAPSLSALPEAVRAWLAQVEPSCEISPDLYDALAILATGRRPELLIVDIDVVDWNEMEFFRQAGLLCRKMRILVTGPGHQRAKLEAACKQGASLFDPRAVADISFQPPPQARDIGNGGLLAGSLRPTPEKTTSSVDLRVPTPRIKPAKPAIKSEPRPEPPVRLVVPSEEQDNEAPVFFPWSPNPNRPKRTPPKTAPATGQETDQTAAADQPQSDHAAANPPPIQLTSEEIDALMGGPEVETDEPRKERRQC